MSKWSSVRSKLLAGAVVLLAACGQRGGGDGGDGANGATSGVVTRPDTSVEEVASAEPGTDRHQWTAADAQSRAITGNLTASVEGRGGPLMLAFATGITEQGERDVQITGADSYGATGASFASILKSNPAANVYLYRVSAEVLAPVARNGGLCGADRTTFLAVAEYVGSKGDWVMKVAAFKGPNRPGSGAEAVLCASFFYVSP